MVNLLFVPALIHSQSLEKAFILKKIKAISTLGKSQKACWKLRVLKIDCARIIHLAVDIDLLIQNAFANITVCYWTLVSALVCAFISWSTANGLRSDYSCLWLPFFHLISSHRRMFLLPFEYGVEWLCCFSCRIMVTKLWCFHQILCSSDFRIYQWIIQAPLQNYNHIKEGTKSISWIEYRNTLYWYGVRMCWSFSVMYSVNSSKVLVW